MNIRLEHYDVVRRAAIMILRHFDARFGLRNSEMPTPLMVTINVRDFSLIRRAFFMVLRHCEKQVKGKVSNQSHPCSTNAEKETA